MTLSLIIPTYNEAPFIILTLQALTSTFESHDKLDWEIIVADNGSTDNTGALVLGLGDERIRLVHVGERGKGRAVRAGVSNARGTIIGFTDVDLSVSPEEIVQVFLRAQKNPTQVVIGSRYHVQSSMPGREWWRIGSSYIFNMLAHMIVGTRASDTQCPLKVMSTTIVPILLATREETWFFDLEFIALLERLAIPIAEVPVTWDEHRYPLRRSKLSTTRDGIRAVVAMFRIRNRLSSQLVLLKNLFREPALKI